MADDLKLRPVRHDHKAFLEKASERRGFNEAYEALKFKYGLTRRLVAADRKRRKGTIEY